MRRAKTFSGAGVLRYLWKGVLGLVLILALVIGAGLGYRAWCQHEGGALMRIATPQGIDDALFVELGGAQQWVTIRGRDRNNPVILVLHGGPGSAMAGLAPAFVPWEQNFTVVQWDQPGAGRTFRAAGRRLPPNLAVESMARDGVELAEWLQRRLGKDRVILLGWSWGSILGVHMIKARPELFAAYVGTGQVVAMQEGEAVAYANVLAKARERSDTAALAELEAIGAPPYVALAEIDTQRKWASRYELDRSLEAAFVLPQLFAPRTTLADIYDLARGTLASTTHFVGPDMTGPMTQIDLRRLGLDFTLPMFVVQGVADDFTPAALSRAWLDAISAPQKAFVSIENAGHFALTERNEEFLRILEEQVRPLAMRSAPAGRTLSGLEPGAR
jgi:pimeloyl-ACP methyl ester carboxylesterase